jgi:hypothetical protein
MRLGDEPLNESIFELCMFGKVGRLDYSILKGASKMVHARFFIAAFSVCSV